MANLLLARATTRGRELAVRVALGATRGDLMRQMLAESAVVAIGRGVGALLALWGVRLMRDALPAELVRFNPGWTRISVNADALVHTRRVARHGAAHRPIPALVASRADPQQALKESARTATGTGSRQRLRSALVVGEWRSPSCCSWAPDSWSAASSGSSRRTRVSA